MAKEVTRRELLLGAAGAAVAGALPRPAPGLRPLVKVEGLPGVRARGYEMTFTFAGSLLVVNPAIDRFSDLVTAELDASTQRLARAVIQDQSDLGKSPNER